MRETLRIQLVNIVVYVVNFGQIYRWGKIYLENIDTFGVRFTHKISMGLHLGYKISLKNFVMFMWVRPKGISLIPGSSSLKIADFGMVSESLRLRMIVTMNRESGAVPR